MQDGARVLVVEDDVDIRSALVEYLSLEGYDVAAAENGRDGLARLQTGPTPHAVLLDVHMPVMDGMTALQRMRQNPAWAEIPVILASADPVAPTAQADGFLQKPFTLDELMSALSDVFDADRRV
jgi:CheY-like chemotaxis protein